MLHPNFLSRYSLTYCTLLLCNPPKPSSYSLAHGKCTCYFTSPSFPMLPYKLYRATALPSGPARQSVGLTSVLYTPHDQPSHTCRTSIWPCTAICGPHKRFIYTTHMISRRTCTQVFCPLTQPTQVPLPIGSDHRLMTVSESCTFDFTRATLYLSSYTFNHTNATHGTTGFAHHVDCTLLITSRRRSIPHGH
jgi:hypothetical protein